MENRSDQSAFSLVEITLALAIAAVSLVTILAMVPQAMEASRSSADRTAIGAVLEDVQEEIRGLPLEEGAPTTSPLYYDVQGRPTPFDPDEPISEPAVTPPFFRVDLELVPMAESTSLDNAEGLLAACISLTWPLDEKGMPRRKDKAGIRFSRPVNTLTGPDWQVIDPEYEPKVEY